MSNRNIEEMRLGLERLWNAMAYASNNKDSLAFQFYPRKPSLGHFSYESYDLIEEKGPLELPKFYQNIMMKFGGTQFTLSASMPSKYGACMHNYKYLNEDYSLMGHSFEKVYFWDILEPVIIYFSDDYGLVGLKDLEGEKWIRII